jgi:tryptophan-rich sensory protein
MTMAFDFRPARNGRSLAILVLATVLVTLALNGLIFALGWAGPSAASGRVYPLLPPGWAIGAVWVVLLALLAVAYWRLASDEAPEARRLGPWVLLLVAACLAYPLYTAGLSNETAGFIGNLATIVASAFLAGRVWPASRLAAALILLPAIWVSFATFALLFGR